jgi:para-nitrobenzyl esterase
MSRLFEVWAVLVVLAPLSAALKEPVRVAGGLVSGAPGSHPSVRVFKGVPYAAPPVGNLRWRPPMPVVAWQGVRKADQFGPSCMQTIREENKPWTHEFLPHNAVSEDCLSLNVWTAARSAGDKRPVLVWIHGGANIDGGSSVALYDGEQLARKGLVVVTINYRVNVLGFFTHPELTKESDNLTSGNYGLLDQLAAIRWVHDNIAAFGGDPSRVTVGGQSAGASDAHALTASPLAKGLFHRVIAQSGSSAGSGRGRSLADQEKDGVKFAEAKGARSLADLRAMSWQDLMAPLPGGTSPPRFDVVIDRYLLPASISEVFAQGKQNDVPTLTGWSADEGGGSPRPDVTLEAFRERVQRRFPAIADTLLKLYPAATNEQAGQAQNDMARDMQRVSTYVWAVNRAKTAKTRVYTFYWDHPLPGPDAATLGAFHSSELAYMFNSLARSDRPFTDADRKIAKMMSSYWANFVSKGNPNGRGLPHWPAVGERPRVTMELGDRTGPIPLTGDRAKQEVFEQLFATADTN